MPIASFQVRDRNQRKRRINVILETEHYLIVDKPAGIPVIRDRWDANLPNVRELVQKQYEKKLGSLDQAVWIVHRIDMDTSGLILLARNEEAHRALNKLFQERQVRKFYQAVTLGHPTPASGEINAAIEEHPSRKRRMRIARKGKAALTHYETLESFQRYALLQLSPVSGRTHQIRVHLQHIGTPLAVDPLYGEQDSFNIGMLKRQARPRDGERELSSLIDRLTLHASRLEFADPFSGKPVAATSPLPKDFQALLKALRKYDRTG